MTLSPKQRGVLKGIISGALVTVFGLVLTVLWHPVQLIPVDRFDDRLVFSLRWDSILILCLAFSIGRLARYRFFSPEDIDGGGLSQGTSRAQILQSTLQNTLEQAMLGVLTHTLWALTMPIAWLAAIPIAAILFLAGRILFFRGYGGGAPSRALGFALTFYPSALMLMVFVVQIGIRGVVW